jgi:hypothetical protein
METDGEMTGGIPAYSERGMFEFKDVGRRTGKTKRAILQVAIDLSLGKNVVLADIQATRTRGVDFLNRLRDLLHCMDLEYKYDRTNFKLTFLPTGATVILATNNDFFRGRVRNEVTVKEI